MYRNLLGSGPDSGPRSENVFHDFTQQVLRRTRGTVLRQYNLLLWSMTQYGNEAAEWEMCSWRFFKKLSTRRASKILHLLGLFVISDLIKLP